MLAKRSIALTAAVLPEPILRRESIADSRLAEQLLADAQLQAERLLQQQQQANQALQRQALAEFWEVANGFLQGLQEQRQEQQRQMHGAVQRLLSEALQQLLDDTTLAERARAVLRNLALSQSCETLATLSCPVEMLEPVSQWLGQSRFADYWQLKVDPSMAPGALRLSHAQGVFEIAWKDLREGLLGASAEA